MAYLFEGSLWEILLLDLEDILESYEIPDGTFKIVFLWVRYSPTSLDPPVGSYSHDFLLKFKS